VTAKFINHVQLNKDQKHVLIQISQKMMT